jgi:hypothetical protein
MAGPARAVSKPAAIQSSEQAPRAVSRRVALRSAAALFLGVAGAALIGCGSGGKRPQVAASTGAAGTGGVKPAGGAAAAAGSPVGSQGPDRGGPDPFFLYQEVLTADRPSVYGYIADRGCVPSGEFRRGERIVFRFQILEKRTGQFVTDNDAKLVKLHLSTGEEATGDFKQRGEGRVSDAPWTWDICWDVPLNYPLGALDYYFEIATKEGRAGTWKAPSLIDPARGIDSRPRILPQDISLRTETPR